MILSTASVRKPNGWYCSMAMDSDATSDRDTVQCVHCGRHWIWDRAILEALKGDLGFCQRCNGITCGKECQACVPQEQMLDNIEAGRLDWRTYRPTVVGMYSGK